MEAQKKEPSNKRVNENHDKGTIGGDCLWCIRFIYGMDDILPHGYCWIGK